MIIDCHCHAGKGDGLTAPWNTDAPLSRYLRRAGSAGIDRTVVFAALNSDYSKANAALARIVARHPHRLIGFAMVNARNDAGRVRSIVATSVDRWGFRGIKVHGGEAQLSREVCEVAQEFQLPVLYDVAGRAQVMDMVAPQYPDVNFIVPHLGSFADDWHAHLDVIRQLGQYANLYADTSGVRRFDYLVQAIRAGGPGKLLFGSDGPWLHPGLELHKIRLLGLSPVDESAVLGGNLLLLLGRVRAKTKAVHRSSPERDEVLLPRSATAGLRLGYRHA